MTDARHVNRNGWPSGPWDEEPDRVAPFRRAGLLCFLRRHHWGYWCGYVALPSDHPFHGWETDDFQELPVQILDDEREVTYAGSARRLWPADEAYPDGSHFIGFSCGDAYDLTPKSFAYFQRFVGSLREADPINDPMTHRVVEFPEPQIELLPYRTLAYARRQLEQLADVLARSQS